MKFFEHLLDAGAISLTPSAFQDIPVRGVGGWICGELLLVRYGSGKSRVLTRDEMNQFSPDDLPKREGRADIEPDVGYMFEDGVLTVTMIGMMERGHCQPTLINLQGFEDLREIKVVNKGCFIA